MKAAKNAVKGALGLPQELPLEGNAAKLLAEYDAVCQSIAEFRAALQELEAQLALNEQAGVSVAEQLPPLLPGLAAEQSSSHKGRSASAVPQVAVIAVVDDDSKKVSVPPVVASVTLAPQSDQPPLGTTEAAAEVKDLGYRGKLQDIITALNDVSGQDKYRLVDSSLATLGKLTDSNGGAALQTTELSASIVAVDAEQIPKSGETIGEAQQKVVSLKKFLGEQKKAFVAINEDVRKASADVLTRLDEFARALQEEQEDLVNMEALFSELETVWLPKFAPDFIFRTQYQGEVTQWLGLVENHKQLLVKQQASLAEKIEQLSYSMTSLDLFLAQWCPDVLRKAYSWGASQVSANRQPDQGHLATMYGSLLQAHEMMQLRMKESSSQQQDRKDLQTFYDCLIKQFHAPFPQWIEDLNHRLNALIASTSPSQRDEIASLREEVGLLFNFAKKITEYQLKGEDAFPKSTLIELGEISQRLYKAFPRTRDVAEVFVSSPKVDGGDSSSSHAESSTPLAAVEATASPFPLTGGGGVGGGGTDGLHPSLAPRSTSNRSRIGAGTLTLIAWGPTIMLAQGLLMTAPWQGITSLNQITLNQWELYVVMMLSLVMSVLVTKSLASDCCSPKAPVAAG